MKLCNACTSFGHVFPWRPSSKFRLPTSVGHYSQGCKIISSSNTFLRSVAQKRSDERRVVWRELAVLAIAVVVPSHLVLVHLNSQSGAFRNTPFGTCGDRERLLQDVVTHYLRGLLIAVNHVGQRQQDMVRRSGSNP